MLTLLIAALVVLLSYWGIRFYMTVQVSKKIINATVPYEKEASGTGPAVLVLGDSTAVGIGANRPQESVAGRVSAYLAASSVENYARSGAVTNDLPGQIAQATLPRYELILIQIGGNDIIRFMSASRATEHLKHALSLLPPADKVVIISAGDVGGATLFPFPVRPFHTKLNKEYHAAFAALALEEGVTYVNFADAPSTKKINEDPKTYLAADGLHPSSEGYRLWFEEIRSSL